MEFVDMEIKVQCLDNDTCRVSVVRSPGGESEELVRLPDLWRDPARNLRLRTSSPSVEASLVARDAIRRALSCPEVTLPELGRALFSVLLPGAVHTRFTEARGIAQARRNCGVRIKLRLTPVNSPFPDVSELPWEFLYRAETRDFLALDRAISIVRYLEVPRPAETQPLPTPLRVGVLMAGPKDLPALSLATELRNLRATAGRARRIEVTAFRRRDYRSLRDHLAKKRINVLHFMGHGVFDNELGRGFLAFENGAGFSARLGGETLATILKGVESLGLVVLNACQTAVSSSREDPFGGIASALVLGGTPAVVAMQFAVSDQAAIAFSKTFYTCLAKGNGLDEAVTEGRVAIYSANPSGVEWGAPTLFTRSTTSLAPDRAGPMPKEEGFEELGIGERLLKSGDLAGAEIHLRRASDLQPENWNAVMSLCICLLSDRIICRLPGSVADEVNNMLSRVLESGQPQFRRLAQLLLGVLHYDFYRLQSPGATLNLAAGIFRDLSHRTPSAGERIAFARIQVSRDAAILLNLDT